MFTRRHLLCTSAALAMGRGFAVTDGLEAAEHPVRITAVKPYLLETTLKRAFGVSISQPLDKRRRTLLVKIETDAGIAGWGETYPILGARGAIADQIGPALIGENPLAYRKVMKKSWGRVFYNPLAVGALETAINDIRGKLLGKPVSALFGGRLRERVPAYASTMNYLEGVAPEELYPRQACEHVELGFTALKMRLGRYSVNREIPIAQSVRAAVGKDIQLMADGNAAYASKGALAMGQALAELDFAFWEEPLPQAPDYAGYEQLRKKLAIPLAGGEALADRVAAKRLLNRGCFDIIQPDLALCGGISELLFIAELAALHSVQTTPHCWGGAILIASTLHTLSLLADPTWGHPTHTPMLELDQSENPWRTEITDVSFQVGKDGHVAVPTKPGLGINVDEEAVKRFQIQ
ncbi:MAG: mandelate racemase [Planctomycetaceae bacterium]|nr:mandelate racemase [Planctomycetaceae bacterium]